MQEALDYATRLDIPFVFSSNGATIPLGMRVVHTTYQVSILEVSERRESDTCMILIVTERCDPHTDFVEPEFDRRGVSWVRLHLSELPTATQASYRVDGEPRAGTLTIRGRTIDLSRVRGVWYRRTERFFLPGLSATEEAVARVECQAFIEGLWGWLGDAHWVSTPGTIRAASSKAEQLSRARQMGFRVPKTLFSNEPERVRQFADTIEAEGARCIYKPHGSIIVDTGDGNRGVVYTRLLGREERGRLDEIRLSPGIFQEYIEKRAELRVNVIGDRVFACMIDSQSKEATRVDWRAASWIDPDEILPHAPAGLPPDVENFCRSFVHSYGLRFGAIDLILTPSKEYVLLELNPNGQWAWIEQRTGLPMASALVDELCCKADRRSK